MSLGRCVAKISQGTEKVCDDRCKYDCVLSFKLHESASLIASLQQPQHSAPSGRARQPRLEHLGSAQTGLDFF